MKKICCIFVLANLSACAPHYMAMPDDPRYAPIIPDVVGDPVAMGGSMYIEGAGLSLYQDMKAHRVGDIITVKLKESTKASKDAKTNSKKEYKNTVADPTIFGNQKHNLNAIKNKIPYLHGDIPLMHGEKESTLEMGIDSKNEFKGAGDSAQNNSLVGDITVSVAQILPNKNLLIRGEKWITLNQGSEYIRISGVVRPQDIGPNNEVLSNRIADARLTYSGKGTLADANTTGWLARFFNSPIFPF